MLVTKNVLVNIMVSATIAAKLLAEEQKKRKAAVEAEAESAALSSPLPPCDGTCSRCHTHGFRVNSEVADVWVKSGEAELGVLKDELYNQTITADRKITLQGLIKAKQQSNRSGRATRVRVSVFHPPFKCVDCNRLCHYECAHFLNWHEKSLETFDTPAQNRIKQMMDEAPTTFSSIAGIPVTGNVPPDLIIGGHCGCVGEVRAIFASGGVITCDTEQEMEESGEIMDIASFHRGITKVISLLGDTHAPGRGCRAAQGVTCTSSCGFCLTGQFVRSRYVFIHLPFLCSCISALCTFLLLL